MSEIGLMFAFDGASRGNPGKASQGNCAWWGAWQHGCFHEEGLLFRRGRNLGRQTNNFAEVRGLTFAVKAALHLHFWMLEGCARTAARRLYYDIGE
jgi:ribonuclease HI